MRVLAPGNTVAVMALEKTIALLLERGRFRQAADRKSAFASPDDTGVRPAVPPLRSQRRVAAMHDTRGNPILTDAVARLHAEEVAQIYQQDGSDLQEAMNAYEKAGEWYSSEDANAWVVPHPQTHMAMHCY